MKMQLKATHSSLLRAIRGLIYDDPQLSNDFGTNGPSLILESFESSPWASLTFCGIRHSLEIRLVGPCLAVEECLCRLRQRLEDSDLKLSGYFMADSEVEVTGSSSLEDGTISLSLSLHALTIEE